MPFVPLISPRIPEIQSKIRGNQGQIPCILSRLLLKIQEFVGEIPGSRRTTRIVKAHPTTSGGVAAEVVAYGRIRHLVVTHLSRSSYLWLVVTHRPVRRLITGPRRAASTVAAGVSVVRAATTSNLSEISFQPIWW